jgi:hypothetical protein
MSLPSFRLPKIFFVLSLSWQSVWGAIDIVFDYRYDTIGWYGDLQKYILEQAAFAWESRLVNEYFTSLVPEAGKTAYMRLHKSNGTTVDLAYGTSVAGGSAVLGGSDTVVIFPMAAYENSDLNNSVNIEGQRLWSNLYNYKASAINTEAVAGTTWWNMIDSTKNTSSRFETAGGGLIAWTRHESDSNWYFDSNLTTHDDVPTGYTDFYTSAVSEIGRHLGLYSSPWISATQANLEDDPTSDNSAWLLWNGSNAMAEYGNNKIPFFNANLVRTNPGLNQSDIQCDCHPLFAVIFDNLTGARRGVSDLDVALLQDIGLNISSAPDSGLTNIGGTMTDPVSGWNGSYYMPVSESYSSWLSANGTGGVGGFKSPPTPEPHYIFPMLGGLIACFAGRKKVKFFFLRKISS